MLEPFNLRVKPLDLHFPNRKESNYLLILKNKNVKMDIDPRYFLPYLIYLI
ncbi:hypothetical protein TUMEXPCC7403_15075 [Tumidithrix helvetica PCC 7403]